jgi:hypothetical protein
VGAAETVQQRISGRAGCARKARFANCSFFFLSTAELHKLRKECRLEVTSHTGAAATTHLGAVALVEIP